MGYTLAQFTIAVLEMILYTPGPRKNPGLFDDLAVRGRPASEQPQMDGSRHTVQGKNNQRKLILSLCLMPYALCLAPYA